MLTDAIREGLALLMWPQDSFAYADGFDETANRFRGLRCGQWVNVSEDNLDGILVRPEVALKQHKAETETVPPDSERPKLPSPGAPGDQTSATGAPTTPSRPTRFHGAVSLDPARVGRDAGRIADEVISHLVGLVGSSVKVTLEIEAQVPSGVPDNVVRTVTENSRTLKFSDQGFEKE